MIQVQSAKTNNKTLVVKLVLMMVFMAFINEALGVCTPTGGVFGPPNPYEGTPTGYICEAYIQGSSTEALAECKRWALDTFGVQNAYCSGGNGALSAGNYSLVGEDGANRSYLIIVNYDSSCNNGLQDYDSGMCLTKDNRCGLGNPCGPHNGRKFSNDADYQGGPNQINIIRYYNSALNEQSNRKNSGFGIGWSDQYRYRAFKVGSSLTLVRPTGLAEPVTILNGQLHGDADSDYVFEFDVNNHIKVTNPNGGVELYNKEGLIIQKTTPQGETLSFKYTSGFKLAQVKNNYGSTLDYNYDFNKVTEVVLDSMLSFKYHYDANNNLVSVIYPDTTPNDNTDNPRKTYHYENTAFPNHLTGITDENGDRYATYAYDANGKAISTEHSQTSNAVGQEKFELDYQGAN